MPVSSIYGVRNPTWPCASLKVWQYHRFVRREHVEEADPPLAGGGLYLVALVHPELPGGDFSVDAQAVVEEGLVMELRAQHRPVLRYE